MNTSKNNIEIPITVKKLEGYSIIYKPRKAENIIFPASTQIGSRVVKIGSFEICDYDHSAKFTKEGQSIVIEAPFCFEEELGENKIDLNPNTFDTFRDSSKTPSAKRIPVYLSIDAIEELKDTRNLEEDYKFTFKWEETSTLPNSNKQHQAEEQVVKPFEAKADPNITFIPSESCLNVEGKESYNVIYSPEDTDGYGFYLGNIVVRNLQKIPYKDQNGNFEQVSLPNLQAYLTLKTEKNGELPTNVGYIRSDDSFVNTVSVNILNGQDDVTLGVFVDWELWKNAQSPVSLFLRVFTENWKEPLLKCKFKMTPQFYDDVYALDLGTTGIVVAKEKDGEQEIIILDDNDNNPIESEPEIISSLTMLKANEAGCNKSEIVLSPSENEYYGKVNQYTRFRLVPSKFIIGQERIPYLQEFYQSSKFNKNVELFGLDNEDIELVDTKSKEENQETTSSIIGALYKSIFKRFSKETSQIKKLVITYPNTYTIENLDSIKSILQKELKLNLDSQISFVPESDAVAAYYFDQKIMNDGGFFDEKGTPKEKVNVIIYDMGAGTLDLSLISFKQSSDASITASIVNKIGIPLAGNYLNYIIYNTLLNKKKIKEKKDGEKEEITDNTIKGITEGIKCNYIKSDKSIIESPPAWYTEYQDNLEINDNDSYKSLFDESLDNFLECCSKTVLKLLIPKDTVIDTIVFSGRGSKFSVLRDRVHESLVHLMNGKTVKVEELFPIGNCGDHLKTCVAIGALKYQNFFNNNDLFRIENKNLYSKIAVVYWGRKKGKWCVCVEFLIDPYSEDKKNAEFINGTWCKDYFKEIEIKDFLTQKHLYYIQTNLDQHCIEELFTKIYQNTQDRSIKDDLNWAFVNVLYKYRITENKPFKVSLKISKNNEVIDRRIGDKWLLDTKLLENIEDNVLYRRSMWPFITKIK